TIPNMLTLLRLFAIPVFLILLFDLRYREALAIFVAAGIHDALDGAIARLTHTKTTLGAYLDPAADKLLLMSAFVALAILPEVPRWVTVGVPSGCPQFVPGRRPVAGRHPGWRLLPAVHDDGPGHGGTAVGRRENQHVP